MYNIGIRLKHQKEAQTMLKYSVEKGYLLDEKLREGHIAEWSRIVDTLDEAKTLFDYRIDDWNFKGGEYVAIFEVELNGDEYEFIKEVKTEYGFNKV